MANVLTKKAKVLLRAHGWRKGLLGNWTPPWIVGKAFNIRGVYSIEDALQSQVDLNLAGNY